MKKFSEWIGAIREAESLKEESDKQTAYQEFFMKKLKEFGVSSPSELDDDKKKEFFDEISKEWDSEKGAANENTEEEPVEEEVKVEEPSEEEDPKEEVAESEEEEKEEETIDEASVQVAGKGKPSGAKVLATVIIEHMMKENYLKPGADAAKDGLISDVAKVIMDSTF
jgi:hypothetical protein